MATDPTRHDRGAITLANNERIGSTIIGTAPRAARGQAPRSNLVPRCPLPIGIAASPCGLLAMTGHSMLFWTPGSER